MNMNRRRKKKYYRALKAPKSRTFIIFNAVGAKN